jgi:hypothetical protein
MMRHLRPILSIGGGGFCSQSSSSAAAIAVSLNFLGLRLLRPILSVGNCGVCGQSLKKLLRKVFNLAVLRFSGQSSSWVAAASAAGLDPRQMQLLLPFFLFGCCGFCG